MTYTIQAAETNHSTKAPIHQPIALTSHVDFAYAGPCGRRAVSLPPWSPG